MPTRRKRNAKRSPPLTLYPLSLEQALKKALAIPFIAPKKQKKRKT